MRSPPRRRHLCLEHLEDRRVLADGALDPTFGTGGKVVLEGIGNPTDMALPRGGKTLIVGTPLRSQDDYVFSLARLNNRGRLDPTFGDGGILRVNLPFFERHHSGPLIAVQPDGKIVLAGHSPQGIGVARLTADGAVDMSFSDDGGLEIPAPDGSQVIVDVVDLELQADGRILIASYAPQYIVRLDANGDLDETFGGGDGIVKAPFTTAVQSFVTFDLQPQGDGSVLLGGRAYVTPDLDSSRFAAARLTATGELDASFDGDGIVYTDVLPGTNLQGATTVLARPDGKVLLVGNTYSHLALVRYNVNGSLDSSFGGGDGIQIPGPFHARDAELQTDGKIVVAVRSTNAPTWPPPNNDMMLLRFNDNGTFDTSFGVQGRASVDFGDDQESPLDVEILGGRYVVFGYATGDFTNVARFTGDDPPSDLLLSDASVAENQPARTVVGLLRTIDPDPNDSFTYRLVAGTGSDDNGAFWITGDQLRTRQPLDKETQSSYSVRIRTTDFTGHSLERIFRLTVEDVNDAPRLDGISGSIGYTRNSASVLVASDATVTDQDTPVFDGGTLLVEVTSPGDASKNRLQFGGAFTVEGDSVKRFGVVIGRRTSDGIGTNSLTIVFNENAARAYVQQLVRAIRFRTVQSLSTADKVIEFSLTDGKGGTSNKAVKTVVMR